MDARGPLMQSRGGVGDFPQIRDLSIIGNLFTAALVSNRATVEFFCYPTFDAPTIFGAILDRSAGALTFDCDVATEGVPRYLPDTNVLVTRFEAEGAAVEVVDYMPYDGETPSRLNRIVRCVRGSADVTLNCAPRPLYGREIPTVSVTDDGIIVFEASEGPALRLATDADVQLGVGEVTLSGAMMDGDAIFLTLLCEADDVAPADKAAAEQSLKSSTENWQAWVAQSTYDGIYRDEAIRSALALKLMTYLPEGSIVAAPTFSLPEAIGGPRNFDYRYCWVRDSAFTVYALLRLGFTDAAASYRSWVRERIRACDDGSLQLMYRLDGSTDGLEERSLDHLTGYRNSRPVRIGNAALGQVQIDIYGEIIDSFYMSHERITPMDAADWADLSKLLDYLAAHWRDKGNGIWEVRGEPDHFIDAILMTWVGMDRGLLIAQSGGFSPGAHWESVREEARNFLLTEFWDEELGAFTQRPGSKTLDAVTLLMPLVRFLPTTDERFQRTMNAIEEQLVSGPFVRRYEMPKGETDGFDGPPEGAFVTCSFWWIECLARSSRVGEAERALKTMLSYASPTGLFSEEIGQNGEHLGNTPQALSHLSMISATVALDRAIKNGGVPF